MITGSQRDVSFFSSSFCIILPIYRCIFARRSSSEKSILKNQFIDKIHIYLQSTSHCVYTYNHTRIYHPSYIPKYVAKKSEPPSQSYIPIHSFDDSNKQQ